MSNKDKEMRAFAEALYPFFLEKLKQEGYFKNCVKAKNATVVSVNGDDIQVKFPYDITSFSIRNETGEDLAEGNIVCLFYWIDLKNVVAMFKVT